MKRTVDKVSGKFLTQDATKPGIRNVAKKASKRKAQKASRKANRK